MSCFDDGGMYAPADLMDPIDQSIDHSIKQANKQCEAQSTNQRISQLENELFALRQVLDGELAKTKFEIHQSINQTIQQTINHSINDLVNQAIKTSISQTINQLFEEKMKGIHASLNDSINQSVDQAINDSVNQSILQSIKQSLNQPINQSNTHSNHHSPSAKSPILPEKTVNPSNNLLSPSVSQSIWAVDAENDLLNQSSKQSINSGNKPLNIDSDYFSQTASKTFNQSINQTIKPSLTLPINPLVTQSVNQPLLDLSLNQMISPLNHSNDFYASINAAINQPISQSSIQSILPLVEQLPSTTTPGSLAKLSLVINQSINQPISQSINPSINPTESLLVFLCIKILSDHGSIPVGKMGSLLHKIVQSVNQPISPAITTINPLTATINASINQNLPNFLKEKFGGLKKFLLTFRDVFYVAEDHPYNPHVCLVNRANTQSTNPLISIDQTINHLMPHCQDYYDQIIDQTINHTMSINPSLTRNTAIDQADFLEDLQESDYMRSIAQSTQSNNPLTLSRALSMKQSINQSNCLFDPFTSNSTSYHSWPING